MDYKASLSRLALGITLFSSALMLGISAMLVFKIESGTPDNLYWAAALPILILLGCLYYRVRAYRVEQRGITVLRTGHNFFIPAKEIVAVNYKPNAMQHSFRTFGNGGFFGFYGRFRNKAYGSFRAFVTNHHNTVVLKTKTEIFMLSPDAPEKMTAKIKAKIKI